MNKQNLQKEELDRIAHTLLDAARLPSSEIDKIISAPQLFETIKTQIRAKESETRSQDIFVKPKKSLVWNWQTAGAALGILAIFLIGIAGLVVSKKSDSVETVKQTGAPEISLPAVTSAKAVRVPQYFEKQADYQKTTANASKNRNLSERTVLKSKVNQLPKPKRNRKFLKQMPKIEGEVSGDFYALAFAGNLEKSDEDLQVLRVELPRPSLIAFGLKLPVENEDVQIKTDLLVSSDGITRAIRLVK